MARLSARRIALEALRTWRKEKRFAELILAGFLTEANFGDPDRAFVLELVYGVLRNLTLLDFWISCLRSSRTDVDVRDVLRLGLYQLFMLKTAPHAAVHETVAAAKGKHRSIVNGMLRTALRRQHELLANAAAQPLFVRTSHPKFLVERWQKHFGSEEADELCRWNNLPAPIYGRINGLKIDHGEFLRLYPNSESIVHHQHFVKFGALPLSAIAAGHCYIQDPSTAMAGRMLDARPGQNVLDACAAPGGKTAFIAELMKNQGRVVACDRDPQRLQILEENMARLGVQIVQVFAHDWTRRRVPAEIAEMGPFDRILLDAPCSNTGVLRRRVDARWRLQPADFLRMQQRQLAILRAVIPLLKERGILVYSTCSLEPEENHDVVQHVLQLPSPSRLIEEKRSLPFRDGFDGAFTAKLIRVALESVSCV